MAKQLQTAAAVTRAASGASLDLKDYFYLCC